MNAKETANIIFVLMLVGICDLRYFTKNLEEHSIHDVMIVIKKCQKKSD